MAWVDNHRQCECSLSPRHRAEVKRERVAVSNVRMPRSQSITRSLPSLSTKSGGLEQLVRDELSPR